MAIVNLHSIHYRIYKLQMKQSNDFGVNGIYRPTPSLARHVPADITLICQFKILFVSHLLLSSTHSSLKALNNEACIAFP
jgi:hypothetical protein